MNVYVTIKQIVRGNAVCKVSDFRQRQFTNPRLFIFRNDLFSLHHVHISKCSIDRISQRFLFPIHFENLPENLNAANIDFFYYRFSITKSLYVDSKLVTGLLIVLVLNHCYDFES